MRFILFVFFYFIGMTSAHATTSSGVPDTMAERVKPCTLCHGAEDTAGRDAYYPRIAGKPQGYLFNQLRNFRDGRRHYQPMAILLENMSDDYLQAIAHYFASLQLPYPSPEQIAMQPEEIRLAEQLVYSGNPGKDIPACSACHGDNLMGVEPAIPGLLGLSRAYITAQLGGWRHGSAMRGQVPDCMSEIARQLADAEVNALAKWLASQPVSGRPGSFSSLSTELAQRCRQSRLNLLVSTLAIQVADTVASESEQSAEVQQISRGAYLTRVGNCMGCHTAKGGQPFAGGHRLSTTFGIFVTPNLTPDKETGIGLWSREDFWQALHEGKSRDGRLLYPAFPYTEYTKVTRPDADAMFAYLQSLPPVAQSNPPNELFFPYNIRPLLTVWRALYFKEGIYAADQSRSDAWNRGAYLVQGLGHCNACHTTRNLFGASQDDSFTGGQIMGMNWYAPSLSSHREAGSGNWAIEDIEALLTTGITERAVASGPMATVIRQSLQYLSQEDSQAMAIYLKSLTENEGGSMPGVSFSVMSGSLLKHLDLGGQHYEKYCQTCHGKDGKGVPGIYPALAGNRGVTMNSPLNAIRSMLNGGYPPTTLGNPQPYGMPPFQQILRDEEVALVVSYIRNAWGNRSSLVTAIEVDRSRGGRSH